MSDVLRFDSCEPLRVDDLVRVYRDPLTRLDFEGYARLVSPRCRVVRGDYEPWHVRFQAEANAVVRVIWVYDLV